MSNNETSGIVVATAFGSGFKLKNEDILIELFKTIGLIAISFE